MAGEPPWHLSDSADQLGDELAIKQEQQRQMERASALRMALQNFQEAQESVDQETSNLELAELQLREAFIDGAISWLAAKWGNDRPCPYCGNPEWTVSLPFNLLLESRNTLPPHFSAVCTNCGNTVLINAIMAGLFPESDQETEEP